MEGNLYLIVFVLFTGLLYAQRGEAELILKDGTKVDGFGEITGMSSIVSVKFKNDSLKYRTYDYDEIKGINIKENDYYRLFRYKDTDKSKYPQLLEIISNRKLSLYIKIYGEGVISKMPLQKRADTYLNRFNRNFSYMSGYEITNSNFIYTSIDVPRYDYYIGKRNESDVEFLYTKGLPFAKNFKKSIKDKFSDCPSLIEKVDNKEFKKEDIIFLIMFYNNKC
jgi:hypothetical protein